MVDGVPAGSDGLIFMPWLSGSMAPKADDHMRGGFVNISATTTRAHMARAVLEGIAMNLRWVRDPAEKFAKRTFSHFIVYGGGSRSDALCQIIADTLNAPVHRMADSDYTVCIGAGMLALERLGRVSLADIATSVRAGQVFEPDADRAAVYDALFPHFVKAFNANKPARGRSVTTAVDFLLPRRLRRRFAELRWSRRHRHRPERAPAERPPPAKGRLPRPICRPYR